MSSAVLLLGFVLGEGALADDLLVPSQFPTIGDAVRAAASGDTILVDDGVYAGARNRGIDLAGKDLTFRSTGGAQRCTIDGERNGTIFVVDGGETAVIEGFTLTRGNPGAVLCVGSAVTVRGCVMDDNWHGVFGGALLCQGGGVAMVEDCDLSNNLAGVGGGAYLDASEATLRRCRIFGNRTDLIGAGGVGAVNGSTLTLIDCRVEDNTAMGFAGNGGGVQVNGSTATLINTLIAGNLGTLFGGGVTCVNGSELTMAACTVTGNTGSGGGGGIYVNSTVRISSSILWGNFNDQIQHMGGSLDVSYSTVEGGWTGPGVLQRDPMFVDPFGGDFRLSPGSAAIDAGDTGAIPAFVTTDLGGDPRFTDDPSSPDTGLPDPARPGLAIVDMGAFEFQPECYADCDGSTVLDIFDFLCFQNAFAVADPYADCDGNTVFDIFDFLCFQDAFAVGCP